MKAAIQEREGCQPVKSQTQSFESVKAAFITNSLMIRGFIKYTWFLREHWDKKTSFYNSISVFTWTSLPAEPSYEHLSVTEEKKISLINKLTKVYNNYAG